MKELFTNINWFDFVVIIFFVIGIIRGRKRGMSQELLDFLMWLGIVFGGALGYKPIAFIIVKTTGLELLWAQVLGYFVIILVCLFIKSILDRLLQDKILELDLFGGLEFFLGMAAGAVKYLCMLLMVLAFLNAKLITEQERQAELKKQEQELGSTYFPTLAQVQYSVFNNSFFGRFVKSNLSWTLIEGVSSTVKPKPANLKSKKQETIDKIINE
ncbi:MAG TPA: CvpA family protein [Verrucomicrobiota bacterium]|nr:CvpA family protein [Verrucomicrobiota bacterium]